MMKLYTIGYGNKPLQDILDRLKAALGKSRSHFIVVDVRRSPRSWCRDLTYPLIAKNFQMVGHEYRWIRALGNTGKNGEIELIDERDGLAELKTLMGQDSPVVLLCAERNPGRCHRSYVANLARELWGVEVVHL